MGRRVLLLLLVIATSLLSYGQVGVNTEKPHLLTELEVTNIISGKDTIPKGIMVPRMSEKLRDEIDVSDAKSPNSLLIYNTDEDCYNYYSRLNKEWQSLCGKLGKAQFEISDCSSIAVFGKYLDGVPLNTSNYIKVTVSVSKAGSYTISAVPDPENGYYFSTSGEFLTTGTFDIIIPGAGTPTNFTPDGQPGDLIKFLLNGIESTCTARVIVKDSSVRPNYTMDCSKTQVFGEYYEEQVLNATHYIEITLNVPASSFGATYEIETNEVDGIKFKGSGILSASPQVVRLYGEGVPFDNKDKKMYIKTNSESSTATCLATVFIIIPQKRMMTIGTSAGYGYNLGVVGTASNAMITDLNNFGPYAHSIIRYSGFRNAGTASGSNRSTAADNGRDIVAFWQTDLPNSSTDAMFRQYLFGTAGFPKIDMVVIGYNWSAMTEDKANALVEYMQAGGILLMFCEEGPQNQLFLRKVFNKPDIDVTAGGPPGSIYRFASITDPILNGPFGNLTGLTWGEDASTSYYATNLPLEEVTLYSSNQNISGSGASSTLVENSATAFRHNTLPFVWVGDGGFNSNNSSTAASTICPFKLTTKTINGKTYANFPTYRARFGPSLAYQTWNVYNAIFTANAIAWCIQKAEELKRAQKQ